MKKLLLLFFAIFVGVGISFSQTTLVGWDFNFSGTNTSGIPANSGTTISSAPGPIFSSVGCTGGEMIVNSIGPGNSMVSTSFSTLGYTSVNYSFQHSEFSVARNFSFQYSLNGSTWVNVVASYAPSINGGCAPWYTATNVAMPAAVDNKATVYLRWLCNSGSGAGGTRLDEVVIKGTASCTDPTVPTVTHTPATLCSGSSATLNISGTLNSATAWHVYTGSCGGTQIGTTSTGSFSIPGTISSSTTYYVRGEGACVTPGTCGTVTINPTALDDASFSYSAASYCVNDSDPTPTITGLAGGGFSSTAGLSLNAGSGLIDVSTSTPGTYTVTYTTTGTCPNSSNVSVTINALDDASFSYSAASYCANDSDPTPTITGLGGGSFSSTAGLSLTAGTGAIDVSTSTPGTYTVTYTTTGSCPNSSNTSVTINALDNASYSYSAASYCVNDLDPTPTITGLAGGGFSSTAGLSLNAGTGAIDVSASTPGTYTVTYTTTGSCPNSSNTSVTINALDDASFSYSAAAYCSNDTDPTPTITGLGGGSFSSTAGLSLTSGSGLIDVSASTPGTYTVTYTTTGSCPNSSNTSVTINALDDASYSYSAASYCVNDPDPTPTITGLAGGGFSSTAGLSLNAGTGAIDVSASTPGTYTVTYTTTGSCPNSSNTSVTINALDDASFSYSAASYCANDTDPTPTITGLGGGSFSSTAGLSLTSGSGLIDVSASTSGTYTVTYTTIGACSNSSANVININAITDQTVTPNQSAICEGTSTTIDLGSTEIGVKYTLRDNSNNAIIDGPVNGTGATMSLNTGNISSSMTYNVLAETINPMALNFTGNPGLKKVSLGTDLWTDNFAGTNSLTVEAWVKRSATGSLHTIIGNYNGAYPFLFRIDSDRIVMFLNSGPNVSSAATIPTGTWMHVAGTYDGANMRVYVNGVLQGTTAFSSNLIGSVNELKIGGGLTNNTEYFPGDIADVRMWNVARSQAQIAASMNSSLIGNELGLVANYQMTEGTGTSVSNSVVGNAYPGTTVNNPAWVTGPFPNSSCSIQLTQLATVTMNPNPTVTFTAPSDVCTGASALTGQGSGLPTGGTYSGSGVTDDGNGNTFSFDPVVAGNGSHTITYTFTNGDGCTSSANDAIEVGDATAPNVVCQDVTIYLDGAGNATIVAADIDGGTTDNCSAVTLGASQTAFTCADLGTNSVVLTATDVNLNSDDCTAQVTVADTTSPTPTLATLADINGVCEITSLTDPTASDNCGGVTVSNNVTLPITSNTTIVWTYDDGNGNTTTQEQEVILLDAIAPTATNPDTLYFECIGDALVDVTVVDDEADNCTGPITVSHTGDVVSGNGCQDTITRTYNVMDGSGNDIDVTQIIIIEDLTAPTASNLGVMNVQCIGDVPAESTDDVTDAVDNCSAVPTVTFVSDVSDGQSCPETITRTYAITDLCGNASSVTQTFIVHDTESPVADLAILPTTSSSCDVTLTAPTATDNCSGSIIGTTTTVFPLNESTTVTWTYTDDCGNVVTQTQEVIIDLINTDIHVSPDNGQITSLNTDSDAVFQWIDCADNSIIDGATSSYYLPTNSGMYALIVTQNGCTDTSDCATVSILGISEADIAASLSIFPNPTTDVFTMVLDNVSSNMSVTIHDMYGKLVFAKDVNATSTQIDLSANEAGTYFVNLQTANGNTVRKVILK